MELNAKTTAQLAMQVSRSRQPLFDRVEELMATMEAEAFARLGGRLAAMRGLWTAPRGNIVDAVRQIAQTTHLRGDEFDNEVLAYLRAYSPLQAADTPPSIPRRPYFAHDSGAESMIDVDGRLNGSLRRKLGLPPTSDTDADVDLS